MSYGLVPGSGLLLQKKRAKAEAQLGFESVLPRDPAPPPNLLYEWAEEMLTELIARNDPTPKLTLAHSLDIPYEDYWMAYVSTERSSPRHRVVARFAREGLWKHVWSLNWDCIQENAFENVGIKRDGTDAELPWPTVFHCFITAAECGEIGESNTVKIIKPHGCALALVNAEESENKGNHPRALQLSDRFLIASGELANLAPTSVDPTQRFVFSKLCSSLSSFPLVVAGWSASEPYLLEYIDQNVRPALDARILANDELSIVDIEFNAEGHTRLASFYGRDKSTAHIVVEPTGFNLDEFFLWLQALYALGSLRTWSRDNDLVTITEIITGLEQPPDDGSFATRWVDTFLPVWVRLCWRWGLVLCYRGGQQISCDDIDLESPDEHIPWVLQNIERPELRSAARLVAALNRSAAMSEWDFTRFPGGLHKDNLLVIPVPAWDNPRSNNLRALRPLIEALMNPGAGFIEEVKLLFLSADAADAVPDDRKRVLKELVARDLGSVRFAKGSSIGETRLEEL